MVIWLSAATATPVAQSIAMTPESAAARISVTPIFILHSPFFIGRANRTFPRTTFTIADRVGSYRRATERGKTGRCRLLADFVEKVDRRGQPNFCRVMKAFSELGRGGSHRRASTRRRSL